MKSLLARHKRTCHRHAGIEQDEGGEAIAGELRLYSRERLYILFVALLQAAHQEGRGTVAGQQQPW